MIYMKNQNQSKLLLRSMHLTRFNRPGFACMKHYFSKSLMYYDKGTKYFDRDNEYFLWRYGKINNVVFKSNGNDFTLKNI